ncbi:hypothetical protein U8V72_25630 [Priestia filamentosa]|uniref:hypothetical protein n=1 Tax=Priestia filamentosa TaxID=1402861 RepID=UPI00397E75D3
MAANNRKRNMARVKRNRRFGLAFLVSYFPAIYIMIKASYALDAVRFYEILWITIVPILFSFGLGLLARVRVKDLKQNVVPLLILGGGAIVCLSLAIFPGITYWHSFMLFSIVVLAAGVVRNDSMNSFH